MMFAHPGFFELFVALVIGHAVADYPGQSDFMAKYKAPRSMPGWWVVLGAHCVMHGGTVWLITGCFPLFFVEAISHFIIDCMKCENKITFVSDQAMHVIFKLYYTIFLVLILPKL